MKSLTLSLALFLSGLQCGNLFAQRPDSVSRFVDSAINIMERHSMFSKGVNWKSVREKAAHLSSNAQTYGETVPALHYAFNALGDKHGYLVIENKTYKNAALQGGAPAINENMKEAASRGPRIYSAKVNGHYAYLSIPFFNGQTEVGANAFAQRLQDSLCSVVSKGTRGIILDLRLNAGGNTFAMVAGISNVLGNRMPRAGKEYAGDWNIKDHGISINDTFRVQLSTVCSDLSALPVAVLIGPQTASAGEILALGLTTRPRTILIGEHTAGYTSGNNGFLLPGRGNGVVVAEDYTVDIYGKVYPDGITPSILVKGGDHFFERERDEKIKAAVKWLEEQR